MTTRPVRIRSRIAAVSAVAIALSTLAAIPASIAPAAEAQVFVIQTAVDNATAGDTINIPAGTFVENVTIDKDLTLVGAGIGSTIVDGAGAGSVFTIVGGVTGITVTLEDMTITGGAASSGGGVNSDNAATTLDGVEVEDNSASFSGGGVVADGGTLTIDNSLVNTNSAVLTGGGVTVFGNATFNATNSSIGGNSAGTVVADQANVHVGGTTASCPGAGSLFQGFTPGYPLLESVQLTFRTNGGFAGTDTTVRVRDAGPTGTVLRTSTVNVPGGVGSGATVAVDFPFKPLAVDPGGTYVIEWLTGVPLTWFFNSPSFPPANPYPSGSSWSGCSGPPVETADTDYSFATSALSGAGLGGGVFFDFGTDGTLTGTTISDNAASWNGGGIASEAADPTLDGSFVSGNVAEGGGGIYATGFGGETVIIENGSQVSANEAALDGGGLLVFDEAVFIHQSSVIDNTALNAGGGIYADSSHVEIDTASEVVGNQAGSDGGGIYTTGSFGGECPCTVTLDNAFVVDNAADGDGGGIYAYGDTVSVTDSLIDGNAAEGSGGGLYFDGIGVADLTIAGSTFANNTAGGDGGGLHHRDPADASIDESTFAGNEVTGEASGGGGIFTAGDLSILRSTIGPDNVATDGGGVYADAFGASARLHIENSTVSTNTADDRGGGVFSDTFLSLNAVTLSGNAAGSGGGLYGTGDPVSVWNTVSSANSAAEAGPDCFNVANPASSGGYNLVEDPSGCGNYTPGQNGNLPAGSLAALGPLADNGGPTQTHALLSTSDAIDAGNAVVAFPGATPPAEIATNGSASASTEMDLTTGVGQAGSAYWTTPVDLATESFSTTFDFQITDLVSWNDDPFSQPSADGLTFAIVDSTSALGGAGGGIGLEGYANSVAVEFDTFDNTAAGPSIDPSGNHIGIDLAGVVGEATIHAAVPIGGIPDDSTVGAFDDGNMWTATVTYDAASNLLAATVSSATVAPVGVSTTVDLSSVVGSIGYLGFTSASGAAGARHSVTAWHLSLESTCATASDQRGVARPQKAGCDIGAFEFEFESPDLIDFSYDVTPNSAPVGVAEVPIIDIPIEAIVGASGADYEAAPLGAIPLGAIPLGAIDLNASPLGAIPLGAIPLGAIAVGGNPLGSVQLSSIPVDTPGGWETILAGTTLEGIPLQNITLDEVLTLSPLPAQLDPTNPNAVGLSQVALSAAPLGSISMTSVAMGDADLLSIDPTLCDDPALSSYDCTDPATDSLIELEIASAPLGAIPLGAIPLGAIPLGAIPLGAIPLGAIPLGAIPLGAIDLLGAPLGAIPLGAIPLGAIPLGAIDLNAAPLGAIPLGAIPLGAIGATGGCDLLTGTPYDCTTLGLDDTTTLEDFIAALPTGSTISDTPLGAIPLGAIDLSTVPLGSIPLGAIPLGAIGLNSADLAGTPLGAIPLGAIGGSGACADLVSPLDCATLGVSNASTLLDLIVALEGASSDIGSTPLGAIPLGAIPLGAILLNEIDLSTVAVNGAPLGAIPLGAIGLGETGILGTSLANVLLADITPDVNAVVDCSLVDCVTGTLGDAVSAGAVLAGATLGDLGTYAATTLGELDDLFTLEFLYGPGTLGDAGNDYGTLTLGQILISLLLQSDFPWETLALDELPLQEIAPTGTVEYSMSFGLGGDGSGLVGAAVASIPDDFLYVEGSAMLHHGESSMTLPDPEISASEGPELDLTFDLELDAGSVYAVTFEAVPGLELGTFVTSAFVDFGESIPEPTGPTSDDAEVTIVEYFTGNNTFGDAAVIEADVLVFSHIAQPRVTDFFEFEPGPVGTRHAVFVSQFDADTDLVLYQPATAPVSGIAPRSVPLGAIPIEDDGVDYGLNETEEPELESDISIASAPLGAISINRGTVSESAASTLSSTPLDPADPFTIQVSGYQGAASTSPYVVRVKKEQQVAVPECTPAVFPIVAGGPALDLLGLPADLNTIFLINWERLAHAYGTADADDILASVNALIADGANGVIGAVIPVEGDAVVRAAYSDWDANPCDAEEANDVVAAITDLVGQIQADHPTLAHVTIVGNDDMVPFARLFDLTAIANESTYVEQFSDGATYGALLTRHYLSDDPYGDLDPIPWLERHLHVPDLAVGRLVEAPADIVAALENFVTFNGLLDPQTAAVAGYDFLDDGSTAVFDRLENIYGAANTSSLIDAAGIAPALAWTRADLLAFLDLADGTPGSATADIFSVNAHSDHHRQLPSWGDANNDESDLFEIGDVNVLPDSLLGNIIFTMGCHAGLSVSDIGIGAATVGDWAQTYTGEGAIYIGNTGYGYGDTAGIALSERLMAELAENLNGTMTVGQAMTFAKQEYFAQLGQYGVYDEKALQEAVFYGLPMYSLGATPPVTPPPPLPTAVDPGTGLESATIEVDPTYETNVTPQGTFFSIGGQTQQTHYRPTQPTETFDVTQPTLLAHGAVITSATTTDTPGLDPVYFRPNLSGSADTEPEASTDEIATPAFGVTIATYHRPSGGSVPFEQAQSATVIAGSFFSPADGLPTGVQRLVETAQLKVLYAPPGTLDFTPPEIFAVDSVLLGGLASFTVETEPTDIAEVLVLYRDAITAGVSNWVSTSLVEDAGSPGTYTGGGPVDPTGIVGGKVDFKVWVIDTAGNVSTTDFKNVFWQAQEAPPPVDPPGYDVTVTPPALPDPDPADAVYPGPVGFEVVGDAGTEFFYSIGAGPLVSLGFGGGSFDVVDDGVHTVHIEGGGVSTDFVIAIDSTPPEEPVVVVPGPGQVLAQGDMVAFGFFCPDAGTGAVSCLGSVDAGPLFATGEPIDTLTLGPFELEVTGTDIFGRTTSTTVGYSVGNAPPSIVSITGGENPIVLGADVTLVVEVFDPGGDDMTCYVDWDGAGGPMAAEMIAAVGGMCTFTNGDLPSDVWPVEVWVEDEHGDPSDIEVVIVVVYDPAGQKITGKDNVNERYKFGFGIEVTSNGTVKGKLDFNLDDKSTGEKWKFKTDDFDTLLIFDDWAVSQGSGFLEDGTEVAVHLVVQDDDLGDGEDAYRLRISRVSDGLILFDTQPFAPDLARPETMVTDGEINIDRKKVTDEPKAK